MSAVTFGEAHANAGLPFTVEELDRLPDDGRRYELLDGVLVVSPRHVGVAVTTAPLSVERPFPVTITPAHLTSRLRPRGSEAG